ncbi:uncharacterized protein [Lepeophtheirus salmonis]|uniref:uncharacterized protein isoform X2 n=1 Tax=Lepeophtheirus salmonis TaxID=72036 RepID=UPI001AE1AACC|nr:uncharacterized protein LOC121120380 isoform X2 [Lepeophtheirus salmonis]XP_040571176.1 uncharacterized protein LOC121120380 isoform X2 [Lepeophtheirus salmonis]
MNKCSLLFSIIVLTSRSIECMEDEFMPSKYDEGNFREEEDYPSSLEEILEGQEIDTSRKKPNHHSSKSYRFIHLAKPLILGIGAKLLAGKLLGGLHAKKSHHGSYHRPGYHRTLDVNQMDDERRSTKHYDQNTDADLKKLKPQSYLKKTKETLLEIGKKLVSSFKDNEESDRFRAQCKKFQKNDYSMDITASLKDFLYDLVKNQDLCSSKEIFIGKFISFATQYFQKNDSSISKFKNDNQATESTFNEQNDVFDPP